MAYVELSATMPGAGDLEGGFQPAHPLSGTLGGSGTLQGGLAVTRKLLALLEGSGTLQGEFTTANLLAGVLSGAGAAVLEMPIGHLLEAVLPGAGDVIGSLFSEDSQLDLQRSEFAHLRQWNNKLSFVPLTGQIVLDGDGYLEALVLSNVSDEDVTVTVADRQETPVPLLDATPLPAKELFVLDMPEVFCAGGLTWRASAAGAVVGYARVRK